MSGVVAAQTGGTCFALFDEVAKRNATPATHHANAFASGALPLNWKSMPSISVGAREIRVFHHGHWRLIYLAKFEEAIYIFHAFQKKT